VLLWPQLKLKVGHYGRAKTSSPIGCLKVVKRNPCVRHLMILILTLPQDNLCTEKVRGSDLQLYRLRKLRHRDRYMHEPGQGLDTKPLNYGVLVSLAVGLAEPVSHFLVITKPLGPSRAWFRFFLKVGIKYRSPPWPSPTPKATKRPPHVDLIQGSSIILVWPSCRASIMLQLQVHRADSSLKG